MGDDGGQIFSFVSFGGRDAACGVSFALGSIIALVMMSVGMGLASIIDVILGCGEVGRQYWCGQVDDEALD